MLGTAVWMVCALADSQPQSCAFQWQLVFNFPIAFTQEYSMNRIVYLVGAVVIIIAVFSFFGLR